MPKLVSPIFICLSLIVLLLTCSQQGTNPYLDYNNYHLEFLPLPSDKTTFNIGDSVPVKIKVQGTTQFDSVIFSVKGKDSALSIKDVNWADTINLTLVFYAPDTIRIIATAYVKNKPSIGDSMTVIISGTPASIIVEPPDLLFIGIGEACSLSVSASGTDPIKYQWVKDGSLLPAQTDKKLKIVDFKALDTGEYYCIASNAWGSDTSKHTRLFKKVETKSVYWNFTMYRDTLFEGDSVYIRTDSLYTIPANTTAQLKTLASVKQAFFEGDSLFIFKAEARDSGSYAIRVEVESKNVRDTATMEIQVRPRYCDLILQADSGSITATPSAKMYRWGDTVSLTAVPKAGFLFVGWENGASGNNNPIRVFITKDITIKANFIAKSSSECMQINGGSLNKAIRDASPGSVRPKSICPMEGTYDLGTIKIWGTVKFSLEK